MPDIDQYLIKDRGIYNYFEDTLRNYAIKEWIELFNNLDNFNQNIPILQNIRKQLPSFNNVNKNIYNDIVSRFY